MNIADFNIEEWQRKCQQYDKNRVGLGLKTKISLTNGTLDVAFEHVDKKYISALKHLATICAQGAIIYMNEQFVAYYASDEDYEIEAQNNLKILKKNTEDFLKILFIEGFDSFIETISSVTTLQRIKYELNHVSFDKGQFITADGKRWDGQMWTKEGAPVMNCISQTVWEAILPIRKTA